MQQPPAGSDGRGRVMCYVPGEICVVVATNGSAGDGLYESVRQEMNRVVPAAHGRIDGEAGGDFAPDLAFADLQRHMQARGTGDLLVRPDPHGLDVSGPDPSKLDPADRELLQSATLLHAIPDPVVELPPLAGDAAGTALLFFRLPSTAPPGAVPAIRPTGEEDPIVRDVVNLVNVHGDDLGLTRPDAGRSWHVIGVTPNWLTAGGQEYETGGGPGARPEPGDAASARFRFENTALADQIRAGQGKGVVVALLDTSPTAAQVAAAASQYPSNWLLGEVTEHVEIDGPLSIDPRYFIGRMTHNVVRWGRPLPAPPGSHAEYKMADHGLFAAGIVRSLVPEAEVHLIRVLGDYGVGDLQALTATLAKLPAYLRDADGRPNGKRLVVNLSLMADVPAGVSLEARPRRGELPPTKAFLDYWLPATAAGRSEDHLTALLQAPANAKVAQAIKLTHASLHRTTAWVSAAATQSQQRAQDDQRDRELLVAAAGNDALGLTAPPATRLPARYDDVLGVGAVTANGTATRYSNRADEVEMGDGIATFGGQAALAAAGEPPVVDGEWVTGIFSAAQFPFDAGANQTGWARWAGTSFATPIITGIAASVWSTQPALSARAVLERVIGFQDGVCRELASPCIRASQEP